MTASEIIAWVAAAINFGLAAYCYRKWGEAVDMAHEALNGWEEAEKWRAR